MWKPIHAGQHVCAGDKVRITTKSEQIPREDTFTVVKTDQHYFQLAPAAESHPDNFFTRVVKYFEIDYYYHVEVWVDQ